jgi:DNA helicase-2/ATP-dependent DNA helicase PcrA
MIKRLRRSDNQPFWGCKRFPACNGTLNYREKAFNPSARQLALKNWVVNSKPGTALVIDAKAGTGKTTSGVWLLDFMPKTEKIAFVAFGKEAAKELKKRVPSHVKACTYHSLGFSAVRKAFGDVQVEENKLDMILEKMLDKKTNKPLFGPVKQLVSLVKANLTTTDEGDLRYLCEHYGIEIFEGKEELIFSLVIEVLARSAKMTSIIDYDDMVWMPVFLNLPCEQYDWILVDEAQDTNRCQLAFALMSVKNSGRVLAVGDPFQSIYGFRGADVDAIPNLIETLNADVLPLDVTYRCPKSHVRYCNEKFPQISYYAYEGNKEGTINSVPGKVVDGKLFMDMTKLMEMLITLHNETKGDSSHTHVMVLCRTNAPLVSPAFALIRRGIKAIIRGRDIGKNLVTMIEQMKCDDIIPMLEALQHYKNDEFEKLMALERTTQAQNLVDKVETIFALSDGITKVADLKLRIDSIFSDDNEGIVFSSGHKAKGQEAENVIILRPDLLPHPMAKQEWEQAQEINLEYVMSTRSLDVMTFVHGQ